MTRQRRYYKDQMIDSLQVQGVRFSPLERSVAQKQWSAMISAHHFAVVTWEQRGDLVGDKDICRSLSIRLPLCQVPCIAMHTGVVRHDVEDTPVRISNLCRGPGADDNK